MTRIPLKVDGVDILHDTELNAIINKIQTTNATNVDNEIAFARVFNVKNYGAVADGSTDDSPKFRLASSAASSSGGGIVFVPKANYYIAAPVHIPHNTWFLSDGAILRTKGNETIWDASTKGI